MNLKKYLLPFVLLLFLVLLLFQSCYSVRLASTSGTPNPAAPMVRDDYYRAVEVTELDTVITIGVENKDFTYLIKVTDLCPTGKLHTVEYKNTFGALLLSAVTFGRKRKVKIKYVCMKE
ncbi:hypothetical protein [uncultured Croceitalea sp.]|uniref:hypothetical protein n=1 Tax=uncultured Croceitalea sp. TaxID=1798908 RepID=UPI0033057D3E